MTSPQRQRLTERHRATLAALADVIAPRTKTMPAASDIDLVGAPLDRVFRARPDLVEPLLRLLDAAENEPPELVPQLLSVSDRAGFSILMQVVAGAYYLDERVRRLIGYPGQQALPLRRQAENGKPAQ